MTEAKTAMRERYARDYKKRQAEDDRPDAETAAKDAKADAEALALAKEALKENPKDKELLAMVKYAEQERKKAGIDGKAVQRRGDELLAGMQDGAGAGLAGDGAANGTGAILASPISFGLGGGAAASGPGAAARMGVLVEGGRAALDQATQSSLRDANSKIGMGDHAAAEAILARLIAANPNLGQAFKLRARSRAIRGEFEAALSDARHAHQLDPRDQRALNLATEFLIQLGRAKEALAESERALMINTQHAPSYKARASAHHALGNYDDELADLGKAAALDAEFDATYREALLARGFPVGEKRRAERNWAVWMGAIGTALLFFSFALFRKRGGDSSVRLAMRREDHDVLQASPVVAAVQRATAAPKGFRIVRTLGQGGMGVVYEAVDLALQRSVALKKLRPEVADFPRERARFLKEARTVAALKHPNIVEIHAIHEDEEGLFLVFERVPGETLHERIEKGPLPGADAVAILRQVAAALDYAHSQGVVHQDLKPANVMVANGVAKVMDFGIARRVLETLSTMSKAEVAGTPAYMAPEQEQGIVTPSADVYALGSCAYQAFTGSLPFPTGGMMVKANKMYRPLADFHPALSRVEPVVARALEPAPEARWPSASAFVEALARALA